MALKTTSEVKHQLLAGTPEQLDVQVTELVNAGWNIIDAKLLLFDRANRIMEVFYILSKVK